MRILLVEDNLDLGDAVESKLRLAGHSVQWVHDGLAALRWGLDETWDALVLDINLPGKDGFSVIRELRAAGLEAPVLVMTARAEIEDKIDMLDLGADDYLVKPFALAELVSRVRALARRSYGQGDGTLHLRGLSLHEPTRRVSVAGQNVELSRCEFDLLALLLRRMDRVVTRSGIEEEVIPGGSANGSNALEVHVSNLRRKIGPGFIRTVRGIGYVIDSQPMAPLS